MKVRLELGYISFQCPGCKRSKRLPVEGPQGWEFNGDVNSPTLKPSILSRWTFGEEKIQHVCHSYVTDGKIQFLHDCTHTLAGTTVDLTEIV